MAFAALGVALMAEENEAAGSAHPADADMARPSGPDDKGE